MLVHMLPFVGMQMLVHKLAVKVHVFMNQICGKEKFQVIENLFD
jgi:hypothetical protein